MKAFSAAKRRLSTTLSPVERDTLARRMAAHVVSCAHPLAVAVVCDDPIVAQWAEEHGAMVLSEPGRGLNGAVEAGVDQLRNLGVGRVIVAHSDLPLATSLAPLGEGTGVTIVGDRHGTGTNVLAVDTDCGFRFAYGAGSFALHVAEAHRLGLALRIVHDPALALDVDTAQDLKDALHSGLR